MSLREMDDDMQKPGVSFGSSQDRPLMPVSYPHDRHGSAHFAKMLPNVGPASYDTYNDYQRLLGTYSRLGSGFGISKVSRFKQQISIAPPPTQYQSNIYKTSEVKAWKPFGCGSAQYAKELPALSPHPGYYKNVLPKDKKINKIGSFGGREVVVPTVIIRCTRGQPDSCKNCAKLLEGDYYQVSTKSVFYCRNCRDDFLREGKKMAEMAKRLRKIRECSFMHRHNGFGPAIFIADQKYLKKLYQKEAYLSLYIK